MNGAVDKSQVEELASKVEEGPRLHCSLIVGIGHDKHITRESSNGPSIVISLTYRLSYQLSYHSKGSLTVVNVAAPLSYGVISYAWRCGSTARTSGGVYFRGGEIHYERRWQLLLRTRFGCYNAALISASFLKCTWVKS